MYGSDNKTNEHMGAARIVNSLNLITYTHFPHACDDIPLLFRFVTTR